MPGPATSRSLFALDLVTFGEGLALGRQHRHPTFHDERRLSTELAVGPTHLFAEPQAGVVVGDPCGVVPDDPVEESVELAFGGLNTSTM